VTSEERAFLENVSDGELFKAAALRMIEAFKKRTGINFKFGRFVWVIHDGELMQIEDEMRVKSYQKQALRGKVGQ
jgi:hypothetical protein